MATNYANPEVLVTTDWVAEHFAEQGAQGA